MNIRFRPGAQPWIRLGIVVTFLGAAGCAPAPDRAQYSVPQYRADAALRREQLRRCGDDPGTFHRTPNCLNAREAERLESIGSFKALPSMGLPHEPAAGPGQDPR